MVWLLILAVLLAAFAYRIVVCIQKSKQSGEEWNLADKYAANDFGIDSINLESTIHCSDGDILGKDIIS